MNPVVKILVALALMALGALIVCIAMYLRTREQERKRQEAEEEQRKLERRKRKELEKINLARRQLRQRRWARALLARTSGHYCLLFGIQDGCADDGDFLRRLKDEAGALPAIPELSEEGFEPPAAGDDADSSRVSMDNELNVLMDQRQTAEKELNRQSEEPLAILEKTGKQLHSVLAAASQEKADAQPIRDAIERMRAAFSGGLKPMYYSEFSEQDPNSLCYALTAPDDIDVPVLFWIGPDGKPKKFGKDGRARRRESGQAAGEKARA